MSVAAPILLSVAAVAFQALTAQSYSVAQLVPHFPLVVVCYVGARGTFREALTTALVAGLLLDVASLDPLGASALSFVAAVLLLRRARRAGWFDTPAPTFAATGLAILVAVTIRAGIVSLLGGRLLPLGQVLGTGAYTWIFSVPVTVLLNGVRPGVLAPGRRGAW